MMGNLSTAALIVSVFGLSYGVKRICRNCANRKPCGGVKKENGE